MHTKATKKLDCQIKCQKSGKIEISQTNTRADGGIKKSQVKSKSTELGTLKRVSIGYDATSESKKPKIAATSSTKPQDGATSTEPQGHSKTIGESVFCPQECACEIPVPKWSDQSGVLCFTIFHKSVKF